MLHPSLACITTCITTGQSSPPVTPWPLTRQYSAVRLGGTATRTHDWCVQLHRQHIMPALQRCLRAVGLSRIRAASPGGAIVIACESQFPREWPSLPDDRGHSSSAAVFLEAHPGINDRRGPLSWVERAANRPDRSWGFLGRTFSIAASSPSRSAWRSCKAARCD